MADKFWSTDQNLTRRIVRANFADDHSRDRMIVGTGAIEQRPRYDLGITAEDGPAHPVKSPDIGRGIDFAWPQGGVPSFAIDTVTYPPVPGPEVATCASLADWAYAGGPSMFPDWTMEKPIAARWRLRPQVETPATAEAFVGWTFLDTVTNQYYEVCGVIVRHEIGAPAFYIYWPPEGAVWSQKFVTIDLNYFGYKLTNGEYLIDNLDIAALSRKLCADNPDKFPAPQDWTKAILVDTHVGVETYGQGRAAIEIAEWVIHREGANLPPVKDPYTEPINPPSPTSPKGTQYDWYSYQAGGFDGWRLEVWPGGAYTVLFDGKKAPQGAEMMYYENLGYTVLIPSATEHVCVYGYCHATVRGTYNDLWPRTVKRI